MGSDSGEWRDGLTSSYQYGTSATRLTTYALAALAGAVGSYFMIGLEPAQGDWRVGIFWLAIPCLVIVAIYHFFLLAKRFASPTFIFLDDAAIKIPKTSLGSQSHTIEFGEITKVVGPRAGKLELRTSDSSASIEASKLATTDLFIGLCQQVVDKCGLARDLVDEARQPPRYVEISQSFTIGRLSAYYGSVILSRDALFFVRLKNFDRRHKGLTEGLSQVIELIGGKQIAEVPVAELSDLILDHHDWPLWDMEGTVRVLPRAAVTAVRLPWWGALSIRAGDRRFASSIPFWKSARVRRQLRDAGWLSRSIV